MGMKMMAFKCPNCGQTMSEAMGRNYTVLGVSLNPLAGSS